MTPLNAARPSRGVDVTRGGTREEEEKPTRVSEQKRKEAEGVRPESKCLFLFAMTGAFSLASNAASARSGERTLLLLETLLIGPETGSTEKEGFA